MQTYNIAVIQGDGIGKEVIPEGIKILERLSAHFQISFKWHAYDWSCQHYAKTGKMMPDDGMAQLADKDAIFLGAVGFPGVPDHVSLWSLLIPIRRAFHQYVNLRPVRLFDGVPCPLVGRKSEDIDLMIVRENNEGEYSEIGGRIFRGTEDEVVSQQSVFTRKGVDRVLRYAFVLAKTRPKNI